MNFYLIILIAILIITTILLVFFINYTNLKKYNERMQKAEDIISDNLKKKLDLIIKINEKVIKVTNKKDYLKDFVSLKEKNISNIEKDLKLEEANRIINNLMIDYNKLNKDKDFKKFIKNLRETDELLTSSKNIFNKNALKSNSLIKKIPNNIIAKLVNYRFRSLYNNKTEGLETI